MKKAIIIFILFVAIQLGYSQTADDLKLHSQFIKQGDSLFAAKDFYKAYEYYRSAEYFARTNTQKAKAAKDLMDKSVAAIYKKMAESDSLLIVANAAIAKAEEMQTKVETAMFDKAVKEQDSDWQGYNINFDKRDEILQKIDTLDLSFNALLRLPKEVEACTNLKSINLMQNEEIDWEDCFQKLSKLKNLTECKITVYDLDSVPKRFWHFITGIELQTNMLNKIPENILLQSQITYLDFKYNYTKFQNLNKINRLQKLEYLNLSSCGIDTLPLSLFELTNLEMLILSDNQITELPKEIGNLTSLTSLVLYDNKLTNLPKEIGNLISLTEFGLGDNELTELPLEIGNLKSLTTLYLYGNQLTELKKEIGNLTSLTNLYLDENQLTKIPIEIGNLTSLISLSLYENQLTELPKEIGNLTSLTKLSFYRNQLTELPKEIENLTSLTSLYLYDNKLTQLPKEMGNLTSLTSLSLSSNKLTSLPKEIGNLISLTELGLGDNELTELPIEIGNLKSLTTLYLYGNQLTELKKEIGNITCLTYLNLGNNKLTELPKEIGNLKSLKTLYLYGNQLTELTKEIGNLTSLADLNLYGNDNLSVASVFEAFKDYKRKILISSYQYGGNNDVTKLLIILPEINYSEFLENLSQNDINKFEWKTDAIKNCGTAKQYELAKKIRIAIMQQTDFNGFTNLSWYCFFAYDFEGVIWAGKKYIENGGTDVAVISNLGLGYLWNGDYELAKSEVYLKYKETSKDIFLKDINAVETAGIIPKNQADVENIKKLLNE